MVFFFQFSEILFVKSGSLSACCRLSYFKRKVPEGAVLFLCPFVTRSLGLSRT